MRKLLSVLSSTLQGGVRGGLLFVALLASTTVFGQEYYSPISVTDGTAADWDALPSEYVASATHSDGCSFDGLKSVKVYCDDHYLNILVEVNLDVVTDRAWTPFHVFLNADGSAATGGYGDEFADADTELMLETAIYADGAVQYNPAVFKWWGYVGGSGWAWTDPDVKHDQYDCWGAVVCENSDPAVGDAQMVDGELSKVEIQLLKELIPAQWADQFSIGFDIQQSWTSVGVLPNAADDAETAAGVLAEKLKVHVDHTTLHQDGLYYEVTSNVKPYTVAVVDADADITMATIPETIEFYGKTFAVTSIGYSAFERCSALTSIIIPNSVTSIGDRAFYDCSALTSITIPNSVTSIGESAFLGCNSITSIVVNEDNTIYDSRENCNAIIETITNTLILGCQNTIIPNSVISIGDGAFSGCSSLTSIAIPNSVTSIGYSAFSGCSSLTSIAIPNSVTSIGRYAFSNCSALTSIAIPNSVTSIGYSAFSGCSSLTSIAIPNSVTSIGDWAFSYCSSLTSIAIPNSVTSIGDWAFSYCSSLTSITIPNSVTSIGDWAFSYCSSLTSITIPNSVTSIGYGTFEDCENLGTVILGDKIKEIDYAFNGCNKLYHIYCYASEPPTADEDVFTNYNVNLYVPCNYLDNYKYDRVFGSFRYIQCMGADSENVPTDDVVVTPSTNDVTIIWPTETEADTYTIVIKKGNEVFCTLTFNADGQLLNIAFAPGRDGNHPVQYAEQAVNGYRFTVTGLEEGTHYAYNIDVKDAADKTIKSYTGEFTTESTTAVENTHSQSPMTNCQKIIRDNQLLILHDDKTYNIVGQIVE